MIPSANWAAGLLGTRLAFFVAGFGLAAWAPLVPLAKERLAVDDRMLGLLLLCLGMGSVLAMLLTSVSNARYGSKPIIFVGGLGLALILPWLAIAGTPLALGATLFAFGVSLGAIDVAMNIYAIELERATGRPLMSGFHAHYSIGEFTGSAAVTLFLSLQLGPLFSTLVCSMFMMIAIVSAWPRLTATSVRQQGPVFVLPHRSVVLIAALAAITFLVEGAMLDWSALLLVGQDLLAEAHGGLGCMLFAIAMTAGRLGGDAVVERIGDRATLMLGTLPIMIGFLAVVAAPVAVIAMAGFLLIGLGISNVVPVLCRRAGKQKVMPVGVAIAVITTAGYAGILMGPASIGLVAHMTGLPFAFGMLGALMCIVTLSARMVMAEPR
ncbi:putative MFS family arabinose efflux permease [Bradyrhizobium elkanii]|uniref:MFS family arabinose efflux permease n=1 Tax=Bradyrhizobium elkanii TaxID=29448 RepID=A0A8I2C0S2_BRAEL|nr:putative MFS family arabinose efflux permease [Bradyrhizobium elkanii]MCS4007574.1 putative MFS family arabinose efflux permease [Bradyrhizobium elkanii USDA 61]MCP1755444.1 putative MFS family arabinose efflux permease [Bradyrhizobium elkanii]MCP1929105.1 putative MFS family arabinose efflux permease [Bradyrhizobium elkanii]MCP1980961.1 putative MFS family arabinose efflux permease [Bradyrhizobium elkanii]